jgi:NTE family protein
VRVAGEFYCDGGLRQNVPLSPARRLGADGIIAISPHHLPLHLPDDAEVRAVERVFPGPLFLLGKTLNALLLDRIDSDIERLRRINDILEAGCRRFGPDFLDELNQEMGNPPGRAALRPLATVVVRASQDIGQMSAEYVREPAFAARNKGILARMLRRLADSEGGSQADLLSYLLFDGEFAGRLIEMGRGDARRQHDELCAFFERLAPAG